MNDTLTLPLHVVALFNALGAAAAGGAQVYAWRHGVRLFRWYHLSAFVLAVVYLAGYLWLALTDVDPAHWSAVMRWLGIVSWPLVWIVPAALSATLAREVRRQAERICEP